MPKKTVEQEQTKQELRDIQELAIEFEIRESILAGVMAMMNWKKGKMVTKDEFEKALLQFLNKTI